MCRRIDGVCICPVQLENLLFLSYVTELAFDDSMYASYHIICWSGFTYSSVYLVSSLIYFLDEG